MFLLLLGYNLGVAEISHWFCARENDWGYSNLILMKVTPNTYILMCSSIILPQDVTDPAKGFVKDGCIVLEAHITADAPHGIKCVCVCVCV